MPESQDTSPGSLRELTLLFLKLGFIGFGGPAATIAMMDDEVVTRRKWFSRTHFLDLVGATNLIPGPNASEMSMHIGYERRGWPGLLAAGICFTLPAALMTGTLGWLYVKYGALPEVEPFLLGIKPAVMAVILGALWRLGKAALKHWTLVPVGLAVAAALVLHTGEVVALLGGGVLGMLWLRGYDAKQSGTGMQAGLLVPLLASPGPARVAGWVAQAASEDVSLWKLGLFFLKVGAVLYGSGYVLIAFIEGDLVQNYGWLTEQQLLDAIAIGQFTPGPVLTTATFIGFVLAGLPGAVVATVAIFLPSFFFVSLLNPIIPKLRQSAWAGAFLDAVNISAVALMGVVTARLGIAILDAWIPWVIFALAAVAAFRFKLNAAYLVVGGGLLGWVLGMI